MSQTFFSRRMAPIPPRAQLELPETVAPSLDALVIETPAPRPFTADELLAFADDLARERAPRTQRKFGEKLQLGDIATVDLLGYHDGRLLPFSARQGLEIEVGAGDTLPWLDESLLECAVGDGLELPLTMPDDEPVEALRGAEVTWLVDVTGAYRLELPALDSPAFLALLSKKPTLDAAMEELSTRLEDERIAEAWEEARERVIDELVRRTDVQLSAALVDEEIARLWRRVEAPLLEAKRFEPDELKEALAGWLRDDATRVDAERRLRLALALRAIAKKEQLTFDKEALRLMVDDAKARFGLKKDAIKKALKEEDTRTHDAIEGLGLHLRALQFAVDAAQIRMT